MISDEDVKKLQTEVLELRSRLQAERKKVCDKTLQDVSKKLPVIQSFNMKPRRLLKGHQGKVLCMDWSADKRHIVSSSQDGKMIVWDAFTSNKEHAVTMPTTWVMSCAYGPSGNVVACGGLDNKCTLYSIAGAMDNTSSSGGALLPVGTVGKGGVRKRTVATSTSYISCCRFLGTDNQLLTGSGDSTSALWDVESGTMIQSFRGHLGDVMTLDISPTDPYSVFVTGSCDGLAMLWDVRTGECVQAFDGHTSDINSVKFHPSGEAIATGSDDATCRLYDIRADNQVAVFQKQSIVFGCSAVDFSLSGRLLFGGYNDYTVSIWDVLQVRRVSIGYAHENRISCLRVSPDGAAICTGSWDTNLKIWA